MDEIQLEDKRFEIFLSEDAILEAVNRVAIQLNEDLRDKKPLFIVVLKGAFVFASDLLRQFNFPCEVAFIGLKSYRGLRRDKKVKEVQGLTDNIAGRHVVILEDIVDTGHTIAYLADTVKEKAPASIRIVTLLFKPLSLQTKIKPDYAALSVPDDFVVGYGLDYNGLGRNLRHIYKVKKEDIFQNKTTLNFKQDA